MKYMSPTMRKYLIKTAVSVLILYSFSLLIPKPKGVEGQLTIDVMNVGQGDSILIQTPSKAQVLIDGGPDQSVLSQLGKIMPSGDRTLDMLVLTHPHADHFTGFLGVLREYEVSRVVISSDEEESAIYRSFLESVRAEGAQVIEPHAGDTFDLAGGVSLKVLWPRNDQSRPDNVNSLSLVLELDYQDFEAVFLGDAEKLDQQMVLMGGLNDVEMLKVSHHGSKESFNHSLVQTLSPEIAVISVGENSYGHPGPEVESILKEEVMRVYRTDQVGDVIITSDGFSWSVQTSP